MHSFGLIEKSDAPFGSLSRGMKRRLTIAAALVHRPKVLFLDEPTTGLDVPSARSLRDLIRRIVTDGTTVFLTTHNLFEAEELADDVAVLVKGRIVTRGSVGELKRRVGGVRQLAVRFSADIGEESLKRACPAIQSARRQDRSWQIDAANLHDALEQLVGFCRREGVRVEELGAKEPTLEDAFLSLLAGTPPDKEAIE